MPLVGNIRDFGLSDFLYLVDRGYKTGCLHLDKPDDSASLYFEKGKLIAATRKNYSTSLNDMLIKKGKITPPQGQALVSASQSSSANISQVAVQADLIDNTELQKMLQLHIEEMVYGLFGWPEGEFCFEQGQKPEQHQPVLPTPLPVEHLIMEGVRRIDEWGRIRDRIPNTDMIVKFVEQPGDKARGINLAPEEWRIFARINGRDTLAEIAQKTNMSDFDVCRIVYGFLTAGLVEVIRKQRPVALDPSGRPVSDVPRVKKSLVNRIINRIRGM